MDTLIHCYDIAVLFAQDPPEEAVDAYCEALDRFAEQIRRAPEKFICQDFVRTYLEYRDKVG